MKFIDKGQLQLHRIHQTVNIHQLRLSLRVAKASPSPNLQKLLTVVADIAHVTADKVQWKHHEIICNPYQELVMPKLFDTRDLTDKRVHCILCLNIDNVSGGLHRWSTSGSDIATLRSLQIGELAVFKPLMVNHEVATNLICFPHPSQEGVVEYLTIQMTQS